MWVPPLFAIVSPVNPSPEALVLTTSVLPSPSSGGYIVNCMREEFLWTVPQYKDILEPLLKDLQKQGLIEQIEWTVYPGHFNDKTGVRMIYRVLV